MNAAAEMNPSLESLVRVEQENRDEAWQEAFLGVAQYELLASDGKAVRGPDGFPYVQLSCVAAARSEQTERFSLKDELPNFIKDGHGAVLFSERESAEWIFTYGDLLNLHLQKTFYSPLQPKLDLAQAETTLNVTTGQPSGSYLPGLARQHIRHWLGTRGVTSVRLLMMDYPQGSETLRYLVFDFSRTGKTDEELPPLLYGVSWFLPRHYLVLGANDPKDDRNFQEL